MSANTIGIVGGTGWLGGALAQAILDCQLIHADQLFLSNRSGQHRLSETGAHVLADNQTLVDASDVVILSVRPEQFERLAIKAPGKLVVSLMEGVTAHVISEATGAAYVVRAMPNAAAQIRQSFTPWHCEAELPEQEQVFVQQLLETIGPSRRVPTEACIDYLSALSGTGPAFPALLMTALVDQAVLAGIAPDIARQAAYGVVVSASQLLASSEPQALIDSLMAYRGVTTAALQHLIDAGFTDLIGQAVAAGAEVARKGM